MLAPDKKLLLEGIKSPDFEMWREDTLAANPSWGLQCELSYARENLLSWYPFKGDEEVLETGPGYGGLTGLLLRNCQSVTAITEDKFAIEVLNARYKGATSLKITPKPRGKFDLIVSVDSGQPTKLIAGLSPFLKPKGRLVLATHNRFGLKYWSGNPNELTGQVFDSIEGYPTSTPMSFSKKELQDNLVANGFTNIEFYYPSPNFQMPMEILSDEYLQTLKRGAGNGSLPHTVAGAPSARLFLENLVTKGLVANSQYDFFADAFLVVCEVK